MNRVGTLDQRWQGESGAGQINNARRLDITQFAAIGRRLVMRPFTRSSSHSLLLSILPHHVRWSSRSAAVFLYPLETKPAIENFWSETNFVLCDKRQQNRRLMACFDSASALR